VTLDRKSTVFSSWRNVDSDEAALTDITWLITNRTVITATIIISK